MTPMRSGLASRSAARGLAERHRPGGGHELLALGIGLVEAAATHERLGETSIALERLEREALLVGQPAPVHRVAVDTLEPQHLVARRLDRDAVAHGVGVGGHDFLEVPGPGLEPVGPWP